MDAIDHEAIKKELLSIANNGNVAFYLGVDAYDKENCAYCLFRNLNGVRDVILAKTMGDEDSFRKEVEGLSKYFNATTFEEGVLPKKP